MYQRALSSPYPARTNASKHSTIDAAQISIGHKMSVDALRAAASLRLRLAACSLFEILLALMSKQF